MLTAGSLQRAIVNGETNFQPHIQASGASFSRALVPSRGERPTSRTREVIDVRKINSGPSERHRLVVSDGVQYQQAMLATQLPFSGEEDTPEEQAALRDKVCACRLDEPLVQLRRPASAKELVTRMLTIEPDRRIAATEALEHAWVVGAGAS